MPEKPGNNVGFAATATAPALSTAASLITSTVFLEELFNKAPEGIAIIDAQLRVQRVNPEFTRIFGYAASEIVGRVLDDMIVPPEKRAEGVQLRDEASSAGIISIESQRRRKDGSLVDVSILVTPIRLPGGQSFFYAIYRDISARKQAEKDLQVQKAHLERLFESAPEAMAVLDPEQNILRVNREFTRLFGYAAGEVIGRNIDDFILPVDRRGEGLVVTRSLTLEKEIAVETRRRHKDGHLIDVSILGTPVETGAGQVAFYAIYRDITRRKQAERQLQELNLLLEQRVEERTHQLQDANKELEAFSYSVSHDLRAPLRHVNGFVQLLQKREGTKLDETSLRYLRTISESAARMGDLIDDLLAFSRTSRAEIRLESVDLDQQISDVLRELAPTCKDRRIGWKVAQLARVRGDAALLRQVWVNLIGNAIKYTGPRDHADIEIGLVPQHKSERPGFVTVFVRDNGVGFDMNYAQKLFGVFQRLHREDEFEGTGIGLATVRRIVMRHGGDVWAESQLDQGSTFYVALLPSREA